MGTTQTRICYSCLGVKAHLASPWMPKAPRDRHWALSFSMMAFTASIIDRSEQLWWDRIPNEFLYPASLAQSSVTLHNPSIAPHTTHLACL